MIMKRRLFLQQFALGGGLLAVSGSGLLRPTRLFASAPTDDVFSARSEDVVLRDLFGELQPVADDRIRMDIPLQVIPGNGVTLKTWADIDNVDTIAIVTAANAHPLNAYLNLFGAKPYFSTRIRVEQSSAVTVYFSTGSALYSATLQVKISAGGYGMSIR